MQIERHTISLADGGSLTIEGVKLASQRWGCGFDRSRGFMQVFEVQGVEKPYVAYHLDTRQNIERVEQFARLEELSGFFGFCPRAVTLYEALKIPVRNVA